MSTHRDFADSPTDRAAGNLRRTLFTNAATSAGAGALVALFSTPLAAIFVPGGGTLLGLEPAAWLAVTGLALLPFAALVVAAAIPARPRLALAGTVIALDIAWVAGSALLLVFAGGALSWAAWIVVIAVADMVALFAFLQARFLRRMQGGSPAAARAGPSLRAQA